MSKKKKNKVTKAIRAELKRRKLREEAKLKVKTPQTLPELVELVGSWTSKTFVQAGDIGACNHLIKESKEVKECMEGIKAYKALNVARVTKDSPALKEMYGELGFELADILILAFDIAYVNKIDLLSYLLAKHEINKNRKWAQPDADGVQQHIEENPALVIDARLRKELSEDARICAEAGVTITTTMRKLNENPEDAPVYDLKTHKLLKEGANPYSFLTKNQKDAVLAEGDSGISQMAADALQENEPLPDL